MKKILIKGCNVCTPESFKIKTIDDKTYFIPKVGVLDIKQDFILLEDWVSINSGIEFEECTLQDFITNTKVDDKFLTGIPYEFNPRCLEFQNEAIRFCVSRRFSLINLWTGAGKTFIYLGIFETLNKKNNFLIIPNNLEKQILSEIDKHYPSLVGKINIIKYSELSKKEFHINENINKDSVLIFDECHRIKNSYLIKMPLVTKRAKDMASRAGFVYGGSATISPNGAQDLLGIMMILHNDIREQTRNYILRTYCRIRDGGRIVGLKSIVDFINKVSPYIFYRCRYDYEDLKYKEINIPLQMSISDKEDYLNKWSEYKSLTEYPTLFGSLACMKRFLYESTDGGAQKRKYLLDITQQEKGQIIIFVDTCNCDGNEAEIVANTLGIDNCSFLTSKIKTLQDFIDGNKRFLICTYGSGSEGLNLQFCNTIIFFGHNFNYTTRKQAYGRILRYGQKEVCKYYSLYYSDSVESSYLRSIDRKKRISDEYDDALNKFNFLDKVLIDGLG